MPRVLCAVSIELGALHVAATWLLAGLAVGLVQLVPTYVVRPERAL